MLPSTPLYLAVWLARWAKVSFNIFRVMKFFIPVFVYSFLWVFRQSPHTPRIAPAWLLLACSTFHFRLGFHHCWQARQTLLTVAQTRRDRRRHGALGLTGAWVWWRGGDRVGAPFSRGNCQLPPLRPEYWESANFVYNETSLLLNRRIRRKNILAPFT